MTVMTTPQEQKTKKFNELMAQSYHKVYNMALRLSGYRADAEDLTQEAYVRAYRSFSDYEGGRPFENWIYRIVTRLYLDLLRSRRRRVTTVSYDAPVSGELGQNMANFDLPDQSPTPEDQMLESAFSEDVESALNKLSAEQRELIVMADIEQVPYDQIAERLGKPVGTIRSRLHRTHKLLRAEIEEARRRSVSLRRPCHN